MFNEQATVVSAKVKLFQELITLKNFEGAEFTASNQVILDALKSDAVVATLGGMYGWL